MAYFSIENRGLLPFSTDWNVGRFARAVIGTFGMLVNVFRDALRLSRQIPSQAIRRKFRYNIREAVEFYSHSKDPVIVKDMEDMTKSALNSLRRLLSAEPSIVGAIFRPLEYADRIENSLLRKKL